MPRRTKYFPIIFVTAVNKFPSDTVSSRDDKGILTNMVFAGRLIMVDIGRFTVLPSIVTTIHVYQSGNLVENLSVKILLSSPIVISPVIAKKV